jgi:hypothetical protein
MLAHVATVVYWSRFLALGRLAALLVRFRWVVWVVGFVATMFAPMEGIQGGWVEGLWEFP